LFNGGWGEFTPYDKPMNVAFYLQAVNIAWFVPLDEFKKQMDTLIRTIKATTLRPGVARVYVPGERGFLEQQRRLQEGIPLPLRVVEELRRWARELGVVAVEATG
jgi:LDH2 family malate/lactate/ureidoglycolate dehydrogenase